MGKTDIEKNAFDRGFDAGCVFNVYEAKKQERERIFREIENNCRAYEETPGYVQMKFYRKWWQALKARK